jgi:hypothetical protein
MPTLKHLLEELKKFGTEPDDVRLSAILYDDIIADAEAKTEEDEEE